MVINSPQLEHGTEFEGGADLESGEGGGGLEVDGGGGGVCLEGEGGTGLEELTRVGVEIDPVPVPHEEGATGFEEEGGGFVAHPEGLLLFAVAHPPLGLEGSGVVDLGGGALKEGDGFEGEGARGGAEGGVRVEGEEDGLNPH